MRHLTDMETSLVEPHPPNDGEIGAARAHSLHILPHEKKQEAKQRSPTLLRASDARSSTLVFIVAENSSVCRPTGQDLTSSATSSWKPSSSSRSA